MNPNSSGRLEFLHVDLNDLKSVKPAADRFLSQESRLDVLVNNAGVMFPPQGSKTEQGHDMQFGTNVLGPHLLSKLLMPTLVNTAKTSPANSVRVIWASSLAIQVLAPDGGVVFDEKNEPKVLSNIQSNYGQTKVANTLLAIKYQELYAADGVVSVSFNPGNLKTELQRHLSGILQTVADLTVYPAINGAYTELYSGWSEEVTKDKGITFIMPWGRDGTKLVRSDIQEGIKGDLVTKLYDWCEKTTKEFE